MRRLGSLSLVIALVWAALAAAAPQGQFLVVLGGNTPPAAKAFYARLTKQPTAAKQAQYNTFFRCAAAQLAKLEGFYILSTEAASGVQADSQTIGFTNLLSSSYGLVKHGNGSFAQGVGYQNGGAAGDYLDTGFVPSGKYSISSATLGVVINNNRTVNQTWTEIGSSSATTFDYIIPLWSDGKTYMSLGTAASTNVANALGTQGTWINTRLVNNLETMYHDSVSVLTNGATATAIPTFSVLIGANHSSTGTVVNNTNDIIAAALFGGGLTSADAVTLTNCLAPITAQSMPFQASFNGFGNNVFSDTFSDGLAGVDVSNTKAAGFRWYVAPWFGPSSQIPAAGDFTAAGGGLTIQASTNASTYRARVATRGNTSSFAQGTISGTTYTVNSLASGSPPVSAGQMLAGANITANSVVQPFGTNGTSGTGGAGTYALSQSSSIGVAQSIVGQSNVGAAALLAAGGYFECKMTYNPALTTGSQVSGWPACWISDLNLLYTQNAPSTYGTAVEGLELDFFEAFPTGAGTVTPLIQMHDWTNTNGGGFGTNNQQGIGTSAVQSAVTHTYGTLWLTTTKNGGTGLVRRYVDGISVSVDQTYTTSAGASPAATPSNPNGVFSIGETGSFVFLLDGGFEMGANFSSVQMWQ